MHLRAEIFKPYIAFYNAMTKIKVCNDLGVDSIYIDTIYSKGKSTRYLD
jgi:hypothetical protein